MIFENEEGWRIGIISIVLCTVASRMFNIELYAFCNEIVQKILFQLWTEYILIYWWHLRMKKVEEVGF